MKHIMLQAQLDTQVQMVKKISRHPGIIKRFLENKLPSAVDFAVEIVIAIVILLIGKQLIKVVVHLLDKSLHRSKAEKGVATFLCSLVKYALYFLLAMIILSQFGITTGSVVAVLGSAGLALGLALQGSLANFAGGVLILMLKPFVVGDYIHDNGSSQEGTVKEITIFYTKLLSIDNKMILIPNGTLSNSSIINYSHMDIRRIDLVIGVGYQADLSKVKKVLAEAVEKEQAVLKNEPVEVFVSDLGDSAVEMGVRVWTKNEAYWTTRWSLLEKIKNTLDANGISIPYPQMDVTMKERMEG